MARTPKEAIAWGKANPTCPPSMCMHECAVAYDVPISGVDGTANEGWLRSDPAHRHGPDITPWQGLLAHYSHSGEADSTDGHVTIVVDDTHDLSTDMRPGAYAEGHRSVVPRSDILTHMGMKLIGYSEQCEEVEVAPKPAAPHRHRRDPKHVFYAVRRGDTLTGIAAKFHITLHHLEQMNPEIKRPNRIVPGEKVRVK